MIELGSNGEEDPTSFLDESISRYLEKQRESEEELAEHTWKLQVDDMVNADFNRGVLPARQEVWGKTIIAMGDHPGLKVEWDGRNKLSCGATWIELREQEGKRVEITTSLQVLEWEPSNEIDIALKFVGYKGPRTQMIWGANVIERRSSETSPPTILGVEPISRSRRLHYPYRQVERALGQSIVNQATYLHGSVNIQEFGSNTRPEPIIEASLRRNVADEVSSFFHNENGEVFESKREYLEALADSGQLAVPQEVPKPLEWKIGRDFEDFTAISEAIATSRPLLDESMVPINSDKKDLLLRRQVRRYALGKTATRVGMASYLTGIVSHFPIGGEPSSLLVTGGGLLLIGGSVVKVAGKQYPTLKLR